VRWVCNLQELASWAGGGCRELGERESWRVGCRPVGWRRLGANVADVFDEDVLEEEDAGRLWWREGKEKSVGSAWGVRTTSYR